MSNIEVNPTNYKALKTAYNKALKTNATQFMYCGNILLVSYCKYLLDHMRNVLRIN